MKWGLAVIAVSLITVSVLMMGVVCKARDVSDVARRDAAQFSNRFMKELLESQSVEMIKGNLAPELLARNGDKELQELVNAMSTALGKVKTYPEFNADELDVRTSSGEEVMTCNLIGTATCERGAAVFQVILVHQKNKWEIATVTARKQ